MTTAQQLSPRALHEKAMEWADKAYIARKRGNSQKAQEFAAQALDFELQAARRLPPSADAEPTRSILYRGAASLAYQAAQYHQALQIIEEGRSPYAPQEILADMNALAQNTRLMLYLQSQGLALSPEEAQIYLQGPSVGYGRVAYKEFIRRLNAFIQLIERTAERLSTRKYRRGGKANIPITPFIAAAPPGSFAFKIQLAVPTGEQRHLWVNTSHIIKEIVDDFYILTSQGIENLEAKYTDILPEDATLYARNFAMAAKTIAPDGERIERVGIGTTRQQVLLTPKEKENIQQALNKLPDEDESAEGEPTTLTGELDQADKRTGKIGITTTENKTHYTIRVREGLEDVVRAYFGEQVTVTGLLKEKTLYLHDIEPA